MPVDPALKGLLAGFLVEAEELGAKVTRALLALERAKANDPSLGKSWDSLARALHTLKGTSATLGLSELSSLAHRMEDAIAKPRGALAPMPADLADALLSALDLLLSYVRAQAAGGEGGGLDEAFRILGGRPSPVSAPAPVVAPAVAEPAKAPPSEPGDESALAEDAASWRIDAKQVGAWMRESERLRELRLSLDDRRVELERMIDTLAKTPGTAEVRSLLGNLSRALGRDGEEASDIVESLEEGLKAVCTRKVSVLHDPLERLCRDLCRKLDKRAKLSVVGGEVAIDRRLLEGLKGPLVQLVKNALDHGGESPAARERAGKHAEAVVSVRFELEGNLLFVEVADDGNGVDAARIREVAEARGLAPAERLSRMSDVELSQLLFAPGFSTRSDVTDTSGRGVGLDVVKTEVERLGGKVEVQFVRGQGTRFILTAPSELGSSPTLVVTAGEHAFGVPMGAIESVRPARPAQVKTSSTRGTQLAMQGELLPLRDLGALLALRQARHIQDGQPLLILRTPKGRVAVAVDDIQGDRELVIRPLPAELRSLSAYQGAAVNAKGELLLVMRPDWLAEQSVGGAVARPQRRALVVDDSLTARALHRTMLESGGWQVFTAASAQQGLEQLRQAAIDVVVSDVSMEGMDGLAFTRALRALPQAKAVPVILVSAQNAEEDRARGLQAGADGFLSKADCVSGRLLDEVSQVISRRGGGRP